MGIILIDRLPTQQELLNKIITVDEVDHSFSYPVIFRVVNDQGNFTEVVYVSESESYIPNTPSNLVEVTYNELVNLKNNSQLKKGQNYLLTDYMTTYTQPLTAVSKTSGVIEPLIITAIDINKLHNQCKSTLYPQDILFYEITGDIGNGKGTEGFTKGKIYRRIDTIKNNDIGTDWRHVKYGRSGVDKLLFEDYTSVYNNKIETYYLFNNVIGYGFTNNTIGNDFFTNTIGDNFRNNIIGNNFSTNSIG
jgi:hypothetical protein